MGGSLIFFEYYLLSFVSGDGVGFWGVSCITAFTGWPYGSFVRGFLSFDVLAALLLRSAARGGSVA
jgi:hypothetical protein